MKVKQTRKVSFRVAPDVHEFLEVAALCSDTTLADFVRGCLEYILTGDLKRVPSFFFEDEGRAKLGGFWPLADADHYKNFMDDISR